MHQQRSYVSLSNFISFKVRPYVLYMTLERHLLCDGIIRMLMSHKWSEREHNVSTFACSGSREVALRLHC